MNSPRALLALFTGVLIFQTNAQVAPPALCMDLGVELAWPTTTGRTYQLQWSDNSGSSWNNLGSIVIGDGLTNTLYDPVAEGSRSYQIIETILGNPATPDSPANAGFETGWGTNAQFWDQTGDTPPTRSTADAHSGNYSLHLNLENIGNSATSGGFTQKIVPKGGAPIIPGDSYEFSFWNKKIRVGPSFVKSYQIFWLDSSGATVGSTAASDFTGTTNTWSLTTKTGLVAPANAVDATITFSAGTGAVSGGLGEFYFDDLDLQNVTTPDQPGTPDIVSTLTVTTQAVVELSWPTVYDTPYQPAVSSDLITWTAVGSPIQGDGNTASFRVTMTPTKQFYRIEYPVVDCPPAATNIVSLYDSSTTLEPELQVETATELTTYFADRGRDRHAREANFHSYDHYLSFYWEERTLELEITDRVAKGGTGVTFTYTTQAALSAPEFRAFFRGVNTVAEYHANISAPLIGPNTYQVTLNTKLPEGRPLQIGDGIEIEISQFIQTVSNGRNNYYGTTFLYVVGEGIVPWEGVGPLLDSSRLDEKAWLGGLTTLPYQYSNEPEHRFKQLAGNIAPISIQDFMLGRRLHHTNLEDGSHSEAGNPIFAQHVGQLGPSYIGKSCVSCHVNNGRALPPANNTLMDQTVMLVGSDSLGSPHPTLGSVLQPQSTTGTPEGAAVISSYTHTAGTYADGTGYSLRKPNYTFTGTTPAFFSARITPPLVGMGLLEAICESTIINRADPNDTDGDGISGRVQTVIDPETGDERLGRFTSKGSRATIRHQIASALNTDMGITNPVFPKLDGETTTPVREFYNNQLHRLTRYISVLGVSARRDLTDPEALQGELLFTSAGCADCHTPTITTSPHHPIAELRSQKIHPYTDLLLHDMGPGLADNMGEANATGAEWRTPPLWNIGLTAGVSGGEAYLHDGRARTLEEAILWHGGEGETAKENFRTLPATDRAALIKFIKSL